MKHSVWTRGGPRLRPRGVIGKTVIVMMVTIVTIVIIVMIVMLAVIVIIVTIVTIVTIVIIVIIVTKVTIVTITIVVTIIIVIIIVIIGRGSRPRPRGPRRLRQQLAAGQGAAAPPPMGVILTSLFLLSLSLLYLDIVML